MDPAESPSGSVPIHFGVAGWSYPDWDGVVYPRGVGDKLQYVARYVDLVEINTTFYRPPAVSMVASWARRTASKAAFRFSAKLHQDITHRGRIDPGMVAAFREGLRPLSESGRLSHLLAQFRYDFSDSRATRDHLRAIRQDFGDVAELVVELRHNSWQSPEALTFLAELGVTVANLDYPLSKTSFSLHDCNVGVNGYLRLHGRNRAAWFSRSAGRDETYDYLYSRSELEQLRDRAARLTRSFRSLTIVGNNHFRGKELANVLELKSLISGTRLDVPPGLLAEYPRLAEIAETEPPPF